MSRRHSPCSAAGIAFFIAIAAILAGISACGSGEYRQDASSPQPAQGQASYITARSLDELANKSTIIVIGQVVNKGEIVNMARNPENNAEPDPIYFFAGQIYTISVERYLKGDGQNLLQVMQSEGYINRERMPVTQENIEVSRATYPHVPMRSGTRYLLFLDPVGGFPNEPYLGGEAHPWRFTLPADGMAKPESPWYGADEAFPPVPVNEFISRVEQRMTATQ